MADSDWGVLMAAAQSGDARIYHGLLREVGGWLRRYFARRLPPAMVDDAVQDTLLAVHEKRHTYDPARPFDPWLAAIARYKWIDRLRAMKAAPTEALSEDIPVNDHGDTVVNTRSLEGIDTLARRSRAKRIKAGPCSQYPTLATASRRM